MNAINIDSLILVFDLIGIMASSVAATILAERKGLDILGAFLIATVASIGGGTVRDLLLNHHPIFWLVQPIYPAVIFGSSLLTMIFYKRLTRLERPLRIFDALGLAAFTVIGVDVALMSGMSAFMAMMMGMITATFGGICRDIICNEIPLVLQKEIYLTASLIGGMLLLLMLHLGINKEIAYLIAMAVIFIIRMVAVYNDLRLPRIHH